MTRSALLTIFSLLVVTSNLHAGDEVYQNGYPRITREWTDTTGQFKVMAKLLAMTKQSVDLETDAGEVVTVPLAQLDQESKAIANTAYPHFLIEQRMREIIEASIQLAAKEDSTRNVSNLQRMMVAKANAELKNLTMTLRFQVINVDKHDPPKREVLYTVNYKNTFQFNVEPEDFQITGSAPFTGYGRGWTVYEKDLATIKVNQIIPLKSYIEITGTPIIAIPAARDFAYRARGGITGATNKAQCQIQIGMGISGQKVRSINP